MKSLRVITYSIFLLMFFASMIFSPLVFADAKSDYDYQYGKYRINYAEFTVLKQDYLSTPSLDNQQKAMLSAKQTILSRDLAKASFDLYLLDLIGNFHIDYEPIKPIISVLGVSRQHFLDSAQKSQSIVTQDDLKKFTQNYLTDVMDNDSYMKFGIVAYKIANLVRIQVDSKAALDALVPKLPYPMPTNLGARVEELRNSARTIDSKIESLAKLLDLKEAIAVSANEIFFTQKIELLAEIRTMQMDWINKLIDIDINYGQPQI